MRDALLTHARPHQARPAMVERLCTVCKSQYVSKPHLVLKHGVGTAFRLLEDNRPEVRSSTAQLLRTLHVLLGITLLEHASRASATVQNRLQEIIQTV
jgi:hypothetical protein